MQVTVPPGVGPGMPFMVNTPTGQMQVTCPPDAVSGGQMIVNVPAQQVPQVVMAQTVEQPGIIMGAPVPMMMTNTMAPATAVLKFVCGASSANKLQAACKTTPPALASRGMTPSEWAECSEALKSVLDASFFRNCSGLECIYWCVPGGPLQTCCCLCNPITCIMCIQPVERAKKECKLKCTPILAKYGYTVSLPEFDMEDSVIFEPA